MAGSVPAGIYRRTALRLKDTAACLAKLTDARRFCHDCVAASACQRARGILAQRLVISMLKELNRRREATEGRIGSRCGGLIEVHHHPIRPKAYQTEEHVGFPSQPWLNLLENHYVLEVPHPFNL